MERIGNVITTPTWATMVREEKRRISFLQKLKGKINSHVQSYKKTK